MWIKIGYVKLQDFCYDCGMLDHVYASCTLYNPPTDEIELQYGDWMRSSPLKSRGRAVVSDLKEEKRLYLLGSPPDLLGYPPVLLGYCTKLRQITLVAIRKLYIFSILIL